MPWIKLRGTDPGQTPTVLINLERVLFVRGTGEGSTIFMATEGRAAGFFEVTVLESPKDIERLIVGAGGGHIGGS